MLRKTIQYIKLQVVLFIERYKLFGAKHIVGVNMQKIIVSMKYCYGIKEFDFEFDYGVRGTGQKNAHVIYAPNGSMKSSFAKTLERISQKKDPQDLINPKNISSCSMIDEAGLPIPPEQIFVIKSHNPQYTSIQKQKDLLVRSDLAEEYSKINMDLEDQKKEFLKRISNHSGYPRKIHEVLPKIFGKKPQDFFECLIEIKPLIEGPSTEDFSDIKLEDFSSPAIETFLASPEATKGLQEYIRTYDDLVGGSPFFAKGVFDHYNASTVSTSLKDNGFFAAKHAVTLANGGGTLTNTKELEDALAKERARIFTDENLQKKFDKFDGLLEKKELREFRKKLNERKDLIPKLSDLQGFQRELIIAYCRKEIAAYHALIEAYEKMSARLKEIEDEARKDSDKWKTVLEIFQERFDVPFSIEIGNQKEITLYGDPPVRIFRHRDSEGDPTEENVLVDQVLSTGEARALYILNILFEIETRKSLASESFIIIDDIADSFDYKNKYAIVEYLNDILSDGKFKAIILTHNFDFFRTIESRLDVDKHDTCHVVLKSSGKITLEPAKDCLNLFDKWKKTIKNPSSVTDQDKAMIAVLPLVRNLIEYSSGNSDPNYLLLTKVLHASSGCGDVTMGEVMSVYNSIWGMAQPILDARKVVDVIGSLAEAILIDTVEAINLDNKIILSIAIRLKSEDFLNRKLAGTGAIPQKTGKKFERYKTLNPADPHIKTLSSVLIMTPENIHFNSFMYEPILDMSEGHLKSLYNKVKNLP